MKISIEINSNISRLTRDVNFVKSCIYKNKKIRSIAFNYLSLSLTHTHTHSRYPTHISSACFVHTATDGDIIIHFKLVTHT